MLVGDLSIKADSVSVAFTSQDGEDDPFLLVATGGGSRLSLWVDRFTLQDMLCDRDWTDEGTHYRVSTGRSETFVPDAVVLVVSDLAVVERFEDQIRESISEYVLEAVDA